MKRFILIAALICGSAISALAQKYMTIDSEKVFKSLSEYNSAINSIENKTKQEQEKVDQMFKDVENLYNSYMSQKAYMNESSRQQAENNILSKEKSAQEYQESVFGNNGTLMKYRLQLIQPIQKKVFAAIEQFAKANGYDLVIDKASNSQILFSATAIDRTQDIINTLK